MKAKDYAARYNSDPTDKVLVDIAVDFHKETADLLVARGVESIEGFMAVLREVDDKWQAFAGRCGGKVNIHGFRVTMHTIYPEAAMVAWPKK